MNTFDVVKKLNELVNIDRKAIQELISHRVKFDESLASSDVHFMLGTNFEMGIIGIINGLVSDNENVIAAAFEKDESNENVLVEFCVINPTLGEKLEDV
ncbi:hypothetical protein [Vibrio fluvialis]|uniref:hypothetical protein n=1 Tax=Vibrio fluvialis TaxID=676 RepID=UPI001C9C7365|nr:hypothetical protein [Vibrio fluvialis]MBY8063586.1 hypothetical protein [Vibrio fluvialis]MBY8132190.1 hypothetical protein [Vibrio fluvialis]